MQLPLFLAAFLVVVLSLSSVQVVQSVPLARRSLKYVTLPLKRMEQARDVHGQIYLQQHINRAVRRLARMTRREEPSEDELLARLERRVVSVEGLEGLERRRFLEKRYNRIGVPKRVKSGTQLAGAKKSKSGTLSNKKHEMHGAKSRFHSSNSTSTSTSTITQTNTITSTITITSTSIITSTQINTNTSTSILSSSSPQATAADGVTLADSPTANNSLGLDIEANDAGYLATVQMGTPPLDFLILIDSGSGDLWVGAENCQADTGGDCGKHNFLGKNGSSSFVNTGKPFSITYGTGQVSGNVIKDNLVIADLALPAHTFGVATTESVQFSADTVPFDGLMGLANSINSEQKTLTPVESLAAAGLISEAIVSYKISRTADNLNDGEVTFGGLDTTKFDSKTLITLRNVNQRGLWEADLTAATVNGDDTGLTGRTAILDTGTTLLVLPSDDATIIHSSIKGSKSDGQGGFTVPCSLTDKVALNFGGQSFEIDPRDIAFLPVDPNDPTGDCVSGIVSGDITGLGAKEWLVGDVFLKNAYFSTDVAKNTVSLAKLV